MSRAMIAMSGGVDFSVVAFLMKERGSECVGATMKLFHNKDIGIRREHSCCTLEDARSVAYRIGMLHYVFNFSNRFQNSS